MAQKILLIDNYDSFVYNLYQALGGLGAEVEVRRNDAVTLDGIRKVGYDKIVISPGPGNPASRRDFGSCMAVLKKFGPSMPILGVCLGHQGIGLAFGGKIIRAPAPMHGKTSMVEHDGTGIFEGIPSPFRVMRYHSLMVSKEALPPALRITATAMDDGTVMAVQHRKLQIFGVQFHPESMMTRHGKRILGNFLECGR